MELNLFCAVFFGAAIVGIGGAWFPNIIFCNILIALAIGARHPIMGVLFILVAQSIAGTGKYIGMAFGPGNLVTAPYYQIPLSVLVERGKGLTIIKTCAGFYVCVRIATLLVPGFIALITVPEEGIQLEISLKIWISLLSLGIGVLLCFMLASRSGRPLTAALVTGLVTLLGVIALHMGKVISVFGLFTALFSVASVLPLLGDKFGPLPPQKVHKTASIGQLPFDEAVSAVLGSILVGLPGGNLVAFKYQEMEKNDKTLLEQAIGYATADAVSDSFSLMLYVIAFGAVESGNGTLDLFSSVEHWFMGVVILLIGAGVTLLTWNNLDQLTHGYRWLSSITSTKGRLIGGLVMSMGCLIATSGVLTSLILVFGSLLVGKLIRIAKVPQEISLSVVSTLPCLVLFGSI